MKTAAIWITGAGGFIGRHIIRALRAHATVSCCFSTRPDAGSVDGIPLHHLDISNPAAIQRALDQHGIPASIIHLGWSAMEDPGADAHTTTNVTSAQALITALYDAGVGHFVFAGSVNEYGARAGLLVEDQPPEGRMTNYAKGKALVVAYGLAEAARRGRTFVSARVFYTYGPGQRAGSLLNKLFRCHADGVRPELGPCEHYRDYIHVGDVAEGLVRLCPVGESSIVNLGSGHAIRVREFVEKFWRALGGDPGDIHFGANAMRAGEPEQPLSFASLDRLQRLTGWTPQLSLEEGIRLTVQTMRAK